MEELTFNKTLKSKKGTGIASVIFRKLKPINVKDRYQGGTNATGSKLLSSICGSSKFNLQIMYSDEHSIVGIKPETKEPVNSTSCFGATQLFEDLNLRVGVYYKLSAKDGYVTFDSDEHKEV